jgi:AcrR family transcriptional regulator
VTPLSAPTYPDPVARPAPRDGSRAGRGKPSGAKAARSRIARATSANNAGGAPARTRELRARGQRTLRRLLDAGVEVFAKRGYHAARVDDIVKVARTSHGTFYLYFSNKEDLFRALAEEVAGEMQVLAESLGPLGPSPADRAELRAWIEQFADLYGRYGPVVRAWTEAEISSDDFGRLGNDVLAGFARVLTDRIREAAPAGVDPQIAALALVAMLERLNYYVLSAQVAVDRDRMVDTLARVTQAALFSSDDHAAR